MSTAQSAVADWASVMHALRAKYTFHSFTIVPVLFISVGSRYGFAFIALAKWPPLGEGGIRMWYYSHFRLERIGFSAKRRIEINAIRSREAAEYCIDFNESFC